MNAKRRPFRYFWILGLVVLLGSAIGAGVALNPSRAGNDGAQGTDAASLGNYIVCTGYGDLPSGVISLYPVQLGQVTRVPAQENHFYKPGEVLMEVDPRPARLMLDKAEAALRLAREELAQAETLPQKLRKDLIKQQKAARDAAEHELAAARKDWEYKQDLADKKVGSPKLAEAAGELVKRLQAKARSEALKLEQLDTQDVDAKARLARDAVKAREVEVRQARLALEQCQVKAPVAGRVLRVLVSEGEVLGANPKQPAILFCLDDEKEPRKHVIIRAEVEQEYAGRVAVGKTALIEDDARNGERWTGKVIRVSDWYTHRRSIIQEPLHYNDVRTLECIVAIDPGKPKPRIGQRVRVTIGSNR
jgi:multidrug resistance efflux pump